MRINLDGKVFAPTFNSANGEVGDSTRFYYHQHNSKIWAEYSGGEIETGHLLGSLQSDGRLEFAYHHINREGLIQIGRCVSIVELLPDGRVKLLESWQWLVADRSSGTSELIEVPSQESGSIVKP
jgi:hypothetical protein